MGENTNMVENKTKLGGYRSMKEYWKKYYPNLYKKLSSHGDDPYAYGIDLAKESLEKIKHSLSKQ